MSAIANFIPRTMRRIWSLALVLLLSLSFIILIDLLSSGRSDRLWQISQHILPGAKQEETSLSASSALPQVALVAASRKNDDTRWFGNFSNWQKNIYVTDDPTAELTVPVNKGREGQVFLTYIIDNYDSLPEVIIFSHADRYQWHNDDPLYDGMRMLSRLQIPYIKKAGYINLRCVWTLGCPAEIRPYEERQKDQVDEDGEEGEAKAGSYYLEAFEHLFPGTPVPEKIGVSCCAQFAATGEKIRERPLSDYIRYREWLTETTLKDDLSGRIMEYAWHIIFGKDAVHCPNAAECYCNVYGLCELECDSEVGCASQYRLPAYATMPNGWPDYGWEKEWRNITELRAQQELDYTPKQLENR